MNVDYQGDLYILHNKEAMKVDPMGPFDFQAH